MNRIATELIGEHLTHQRAVVDIQPLRRGDERAVVAIAGVLQSRQEEVNVQTGQL